jgi:hypothetical protein
MHERIGLDIGGVITNRDNDNTEYSLFGDRYLEAPPMPGCLEAVHSLATSNRFGPEIYLVSKAGPKVQGIISSWLDHNQFFDITTINPKNLHFVLTRSEKAGVAKELKLTHFVDDRFEVLSYLQFITNLYLFHPDSSEISKFADFLQYVKTANDWVSLIKILLPERTDLSLDHMQIT